MGRKKKWMLQSLLIFLAVMVVCTIISRAAASILVAEVQTQKVSGGKLTYSCEGEGIVVSAQEEQIFLWPQQQVEWTAKSGSNVRKGECLVQFRMEYLEETIQKKEAELAQLELQAEQQHVSSRENARVPQATGAALSLEEAKKRLEIARQNEAQAQEAYARFQEEMQAGGTLEETTEETTTSEEGRKNVMQEEQLRELETALQETRAQTESAQQDVEQAQNAYELARQEDAASDINAANAAEASRLGAQSAEIQADQAKQELEKLKSYQEAKGKLCATQDCTVLQVGVQAGVITTGQEILSVGNGGFRLKGEVKDVDKERIKAGAEAEIQFRSGKKKKVKLDAIGKEASGGGESNHLGGETTNGLADATTSNQAMQTIWYAPLPNDLAAQGMEHFTWTMEIPSESDYEQIIPLSALREDAQTAYCLTLEEEEQMLGTVQIAKRVPVTVLEKDGEHAAITSTLKETDRIIVSTEKYVEEGDRIREKE